MEHFQNIAVLIDADNVSFSLLEDIFLALNAYGRIVVKKAYGNWKKSNLHKWEDPIRRMAIRAEHQFDYVSGKNTTDIAMVIDAMDLLHTKLYDAFALVSSDSDFTPLAIRLREAGAYVIGIGESKTPEAFRNACDEFLKADFIGTAKKNPPAPPAAEEAPAPKKAAAKSKKSASGQEALAPKNPPAAPEPPAPDIEEIHTLLLIASDKYQDEDGFANVASAGQYIKRAKPDFLPLTYGYKKLPLLLAAFPERYEMKKSKGKGTATIISYRCL